MAFIFIKRQRSGTVCLIAGLSLLTNGLAVLVYLSGHPDMNNGAIAQQYLKISAAVSWIGFIGNLTPVILGNLVGGALLVGLVYHVIYHYQHME